MTIDEIFDIVLPQKSGYARGHGPGPKPLSKAELLRHDKRKLKKGPT